MIPSFPRRGEARRSRTLIALLLYSTAALAAPPEFKAVAPFGATQSDRPLPLAVEVTAVDEAADGELRVPLSEDSYGFPRQLVRVPVDVPPGGSKTYWLTLWPDHTTTELTVEYHDRRGRSWRNKAVIKGELADGDDLIAVVDPTAAGLRYLQREAKYTEGTKQDPASGAPPGMPGEPKLVHPATRIANLTAAQLPRDPAAYLGLKALLVQGAELTATEPAVREAIAAWVQQGGHLVLVGGAVSRGLFQDPIIAALSPVKVAGLTEVGRDELEGLRPWSGGRRLGQPGVRYAVSDARATAGRTVIEAGGRPFVQQASRGRGMVTFVAAPFDQPPLIELAKADAFWRGLLELDDPKREKPFESLAIAAWTSQIRAALEIGGVETPSLILVACFLLLYLIVLVPGQYVVLRKLRRRELAWLLTPLIVAVFSLGAYLIGTTLKGRQVVVQSISLVDAQSGSKAARALTTAVVYSPAKARFAIALPTATGLIRELRDSAREYYYGEDAVLAEDGQLQIVQAPGGQRVDRFDVPMWAARVLGFSWRPEMSGPVTVHRQGNSSTWVVRNGLSTPLRHVVLGGLEEPVSFGDVAPGKSATAKAGVAPPEPKSTAPQSMEEPPPPDPGGTDPRQAATIAALKAGPPLGSFPPELLKRLLEDADSLGSGYYGEDTNAAQLLQEPALWAFVIPPAGPLTLVDHAADERTLWLLRVRLEDGP